MALMLSLLGYTSDGTITLCINGTKYTYGVDGASINGWVKLLNSTNPKKHLLALQQIKSSCKWFNNGISTINK